MYSAIKQDGVPLYKLARKGEEVERKRRRITVYRWQVEQFDGQDLTCEIDCSRGTYVRTLAHDLGQQLGCGAHLAALRRTRSGPFLMKHAVTLDQLTDLVKENQELPWFKMSAALSGRVELVLDIHALPRLLDGVPPVTDQVSGVLPDAGADVALMYNGYLVALARFEPERVDDERGDFVLQRVFNQVRELME
jgi:tRNA pseudouridine55 synthase